MTPTLTIYEQQLTTINEYIETLNSRIRKIDQTEYTETTIKQREFLAKIVTMMTAQRNIVNDIVIEYAKELERFVDVKLELEKEKLLNIYLTKEIEQGRNYNMVLDRIQAKLPKGYSIKPIRPDNWDEVMGNK